MKDISQIAGVIKYTKSNRDLFKPLYIYLDARRLRIGMITARKIEVDEKCKLSFFKLGDDWYMAKTNEKDGYRISKQGRGGFSLTMSSLVRMLKSRLKANDILLIRTEMEYYANPVYKLEKRLL